MTALACQAAAFIARDFRIDFTYRLSFAIGLVDAVAGVGAFYMLSTLFGVRPDGYDPFGFVLTGLILNSAMSVAITSYAQSVRESQHTSTLPLLVIAPLASRRMILLSSVYPMLRGTIEAALYLGVGVVLGLPLAGANVGGAALVFAISSGAFAAIGILSAASIVVWKRGDPIPWLVGSASWLFGGVFFPVDHLPEWLQGVSRIVPISYALDALRPALLSAVPLSEVLWRATPLMVFAAVVIPASLYAFTRAVERARREGTLRQF